MPEAPPVLLRTDALSRRYGQYTVVHDLSFSLRQGEVLGFLGRNGAGKSTSMQMLSGVLAPSSGSVELVGHALLGAPREARRHIGFLPETPPLYLDLTVDEYLCFAARLRGMARAAVSKAIEQCKQRCGLAQYGKWLLARLSEGLRKRVGIAQAIIHEPDLIILDEPTSTLDPVQVREVHTLIRSLSRNCGIVLSTHRLFEVQALCDRVLILHQGHTVLDQSMQQLQQGSSNGLRMEFVFKAPPEIRTLRALPGVAQVIRRGENHFLLHYRPGADATDAILREALAQGWGLRSCAPEDRLLESVFLHLVDEQPRQEE